jgi:hypothetical protein
LKFLKDIDLYTKNIVWYHTVSIYGFIFLMFLLFVYIIRMLYRQECFIIYF